ncbi:B12-binding domain-containing radical SAM protein [Nonomuraea sp. JJY05]|uniref:B12-binding domain-containing radical SAM protein n=1 Tax=Nonomuraea sp. JJY05 TaxID=3350255 RepID=UPI00373EFA0A
MFPPLTGANYPYLSTAVLKAYVQQESRHEVTQADLNLRYIQHLLTPQAVRELVTTAEARTRPLERRSLSGSEAFHLQHGLDVISRGPAVAALLPAALRAVRSAASVNDATEMAVADTVIAEAISAATVDRPPDQLNLVDSVFTASAADPQGLCEALTRDDCPFMAAYDRLVAPGELLGDVVGISVVYRGQVYPALALARWLRLRRPRGRVPLGGPFFTSHRDRLRHHRWLFDLIDAFVIYEGGRPLVSYLDHVDTGEPLDGIPGLIFRQDDDVRQTGMPKPVAANDLPTPDFDGLRLHEYLMPAPVLPLPASRGCYWNCAFCTHHHIYGDSYRVRSLELIGRDLATLAEKYGSRHVYFVDESMSPKLLWHISRAIKESGADLRWGCETRMERSLTRDDFRLAHESGCRVLSFGMESANQRVLNLMNKGITIATIERIIGDCAQVGIKVHVMCIIGFPASRKRRPRRRSTSPRPTSRASTRHAPAVGRGSGLRR